MSALYAAALILYPSRRTISWERGQLNPEKVEMIECLKHWKKSGILDKFLESEDE